MSGITYSQYNATPRTRTTGNPEGPLESDINGNLKNREAYAPVAEDNTNGVIATVEKPLDVATYAPSEDLSAAAEASSVTKASPGNLYGFVFNNGNAAVRYLQFFNATILPADGAVPALCFRVGAGETYAFSFHRPRAFSTGICWCTSSTQATKTIGAADALASVMYK